MSRARNIYNVGHSVKEVSASLDEAAIMILKALGFDDETIAKVHSVTASAIQLGMKPSGRQTDSGFLRLYNRSLSEVLMGTCDPKNILVDSSSVMMAKVNNMDNRNSWRFDFTNPMVLEVQEMGLTDFVVTVVPFIYDDSPVINGRGCTNMLTRNNILEFEIVWKPETTEPETTDVETGNTPA